MLKNAHHNQGSSLQTLGYTKRSQLYTSQIYAEKPGFVSHCICHIVNVKEQ